MDNTLQDVLIRYKRMSGFEALWLPGTDHASIATEVKIVEKLAEQGIDKRDIGRDAFLEKAWEWKKEYGGTIVDQLKKLGSSCDWEKERFTMDAGCNRAVTKVFVDLYEKGLIYRGQPHHQLVSGLQDRPFRRGGGVRGTGKPPVARAL